MSVEQRVLATCQSKILPLVRADMGELYLVHASADEIHIHLAGTCAGCPGSSLTESTLIRPAILAVAPNARVVLTTGYRVPEGATKVE